MGRLVMQGNPTEREKETVCVHERVHACVCVCVCERERARARERSNPTITIYTYSRIGRRCSTKKKICFSCVQKLCLW
jgi:hypothetical protein